MLAFWEDETGQGSIFQTQVQKFTEILHWVEENWQVNHTKSVSLTQWAASCNKWLEKTAVTPLKCELEMYETWVKSKHWGRITLFAKNGKIWAIKP